MTQYGEYSYILSKIEKVQRCLVLFESSQERREDATMEAFLRVWSKNRNIFAWRRGVTPLHEGELSPSDEPEVNCLIAIAKNVLRDQYRRAEIVPLSSLETQCDVADEPLLSFEHVQTVTLLIRQARQTLSQEDQLLLSLCSAGYTCKEIAGDLHISEESVKKRLQRTRQRFRDALIQSGYGDPL
jgi:RNA polymerase sigma factor (sigma-70 family)